MRSFPGPRPRTKDQEHHGPRTHQGLRTKAQGPTMIDSHCHLADEKFAADLDAVVARAREAGVESALVILEAGNDKEAAQADRVGQLWPETRVSVGVHPHQAHEFADNPERVVSLV